MSFDLDIRDYAYASGLFDMSLPGNRFFRPLPRFWEALDEVVPRDVQLVDAGCGRGDLLREAAQVGRALLGIDVSSREGQDPRVLPLDAIRFKWNKRIWPMMCRPSHDGWAHLTMQAARKAGAGVLYVGLPKNYEVDLGSVRSTSHGIVGKEGERLYLLEPYRSAKK
jgi:hypothetical protein